MDIAEELEELKKRGFTGQTLEEAFKWLREEHALAPFESEPNEWSLKQMVLILKIRKSWKQKS